MSWSLQDLQNQIATEVDQSATAPTAGSADWNSRLNILNRAIRDWGETYDWNALLKVHNGLVSTSSANASYVLPNDFKKLDGYVRVVTDGINTYDLPQVQTSKNLRYTEGSDYWVNIFDGVNKVMFIHAGTLASGASVQFTYYSVPASLASTSDVSECPDPTYLVQRSLYYIYKGREDARFPEAKVEADRILARMVENENTQGLSNVDRRVSVFPETYKTWRVGRD